MSDAAEIAERLSAFAAALRQRRLTPVAAHFARDDEIAVISSEGGPYRGAAEVRAFFEGMDAAAVRYGWEWTSVDVHVAGDHAWLLAVGDELVDEDGKAEQRLPYRLAAVLQRIDGAWRWRLVHGSEPAGER